jgi:colanic acid/amylovoran biosynthesis protein
MNIGIMGVAVEAGNRGVRALGSSLVSLCENAQGGATVRFLASHRRRETIELGPRNGGRKEIEVVNCRLSPKAKPTEHLVWIVLACLVYRLVPFRGLRSGLSRLIPWIRAMEEADILGDIRGGDSFSDIYGLGRFLEGFFIAWTAVLIKGSIVQFPQTFGPYNRGISRLMARYLLRRSSLIMARDRESQKLASELAGPEKKVLLCPDVAFCLGASRPDVILMDPPLAGAQSVPERLVGVNVNGLMYNGGYSRDNMFGLKMDYGAMLPRVVEALLGEHEGEIWLVPHTYAPFGNVESDNEACSKVRDSLPQEFKERVRVVAGDYDCHELKWIIGQCDFFIGSRMHSCIAALSQGVPCVGIAYSRKFRGVFETVGMGDWVIDGREVGTEEGTRKVVELYRRRNEVREALRVEAHKARRRLEEAFAEIFRLAGSPVPS